jgi:PAS domain S-box-containing protein
VNNLFSALKLKSHQDDKDHSTIHECLKFVNDILDTANDVIIICEAEPIDNPGPRIVYVNDAFIKTTGYSAEEVLGKTPRILQGPKTDLVTLGRIRDALKKWQPICVDVLNYTKNGDEFWASLSIFPIANEKGWFTHWISVQRSIRDDRQHEAKLLLAKSELVLANQ